jgi:hypothetical protein
MIRGWLVDPDQRTISAFDAAFPILSRAQWGQMNEDGGAQEPMGRGFDSVMENSNKGADMTSMERLCNSPATQDAIKREKPYDILKMMTTALNCHPMEHLMAAEMLEPDKFNINVVDAVYSVCQTPLTTGLSGGGGAQSSMAGASAVPAGHTIHIWHLDNLSNDQFERMSGAWYNRPGSLAAFFPGNGLLVMRNSSGDMVDFPPAHRPEIVYKSPRKGTLNRRGFFETALVTRNGKNILQEQAVYPCYDCGARVTDTSLRCGCRMHAYCSNAHRDNGKQHCAGCAVCNAMTSIRCECRGGQFYCSTECQLEDWPNHKQSHKYLMGQKAKAWREPPTTPNL